MLWLLLLAPLLAIAAEQEPRGTERNPVLHLQIHDAIGPATSDFFIRALARAEQLMRN